jgi:hypothetical protein
MKAKLFVTCFLSVMFFNSSASAQNSMQLCRPRVKNPVQRTIQYVFHPETPLCNKKGQGNLRIDAFSNIRQVNFVAPNGDRYRYGKTFSSPGKRQIREHVDFTTIERIKK